MPHAPQTSPGTLAGSRAVARVIALVATAILHAAASGEAAEKMSAAHASIRAAEAGRHVGVLADDSF